MGSVPTPTSTYAPSGLYAEETVPAAVSRRPHLTVVPDRPVPVGPDHALLNRLDRFARRTADILVSALALLLLTPLFVVVTVLVKATSKGPVFYSQVRVGRNRRIGDRRSSPTNHAGPRDRRDGDRRASRNHGRPFRIYKFRTMVVNAEEYGPQWSSRNDPRITPVGRFLRLTRIDETPQFLNVLRGDMSLIGPRPERPYFVDQFAESIPHYRERLRVRPGITGQAQVTLDYDSTIDDVKKKLDQDLEYVRRRTIWTDLRILLRTIGVVLTGKGAC
jgi:lipopolysaccharide/colanic/teichoic acid biosynthesis glycosyltransferase